MKKNKQKITTKRFSCSSESSCPTGTLRRIVVDSTSIFRRYVEDQISTNFHVISTYFFNVILLIEKSTSFPRTFLDVISMLEISTFFHLTFFDVISMFEKSTLFPRTFFNVISLIEKSTLFPLTFFDVILMVKKYTLFARTFFDETLMGKNSTSFSVKMHVNENIRGGFPLLVTLKS